MSQNDDLELRLRQIDQAIGRLREQIDADSPAARKERSLLLGISAALTIGGLFFAAPTSGLSLVFSGAGALLAARETVKDSEITNIARHAEQQLSELEKEYVQIRIELETRRYRKTPP